MIQFKSKSKGFTLVEILVATTIFALVMIITTGVVGQSASFSSKLHAQRQVQEDVGRIVDMITKDIRSANNVGQIGGFEFKNGLAILSCNSDNSVCGPIFNTEPSGMDLEDPETNLVLVIFMNQKTKVYQLNKNEKRIYYGEGFNYLDALKNKSSISKLDYDYILKLGGFTPSDQNVDQMSYVTFEITAKSKNYDALEANQKAEFTICSTVTSRHY